VLGGGTRTYYESPAVGRVLDGGTRTYCESPAVGVAAAAPC
jgi:hypothetical protein